MVGEHEHEWSDWVWDSWVFQACWRRVCLVQKCFASEVTEDVTRVYPTVVIDNEREFIFPDGNVEYTEFGCELNRELERLAASG